MTGNKCSDLINHHFILISFTPNPSIFLVHTDMSEDLKIIGYQLLTNNEVELHSQEELQALFKGKVVSKAEL